MTAMTDDRARAEAQRIVRRAGVTWVSNIVECGGCGAKPEQCLPRHGQTHFKCCPDCEHVFTRRRLEPDVLFAAILSAVLLSSGCAPLPAPPENAPAFSAAPADLGEAKNHQARGAAIVAKRTVAEKAPPATREEAAR